MSKKILIIGGVAAGPKAACRVKRLLPDAEVTLVDQDSLISYGGCGIPYYVSGDVSDEKELRSTSYHMVRDEYFFGSAKGVNALTRTRALSIDRKRKVVEVENLNNGEKRELEYDKLMLATGATPFVLPIPGSDADGVFTATDMHKAIAIKERIAKGKVSKAVVIGGGAIGIEMAEALTDLWGVKTSLIEFQSQLLPRIIDWPFATMLTKHLQDNAVDVYLGEGAQEIITEDGCVTGVRTQNRTLEADMVIMSAGVRPRTELAREAGLLVGATGGIIVNDRMQTSDPDIYAGGDCVDIPHLVSGGRFVAPFGSLANREGRVAADNMAGIATTFKGAVGSFILKAFEMSVGSTGMSLEAALAAGFDAASSLSSPADRAHFFPTQAIMCIELVFDKRTRRVLGFQGTGPANDGLSARIDAAAVAITAGATVDDFGNVEMAYSPPFSSAIDPLNAAAYIADNLLGGRMRQIEVQDFWNWIDSPQNHPDWLVLDVRHEQEAQICIDKFGGERWMSMVYDKVREEYAKLPKDKTLIIFCNAGTRSYEIQVLLDYLGMTNNLVLPGGSNVLRRLGADWLSHS